MAGCMDDVAAGDIPGRLFVAAFVIALAGFAFGLVAAPRWLHALDDEQ